MDICTCVSPGFDGQSVCSPTPHRHKLRLGGLRGELSCVACDNHLATRLNDVWQERATMVCGRCSTNEPIMGDTICEACASELDLLAPAKNDAQRMKEVGYCINRDTVHGCLVYAEADSQMCQHCQNYFRETSWQNPNKERFNGAAKGSNPKIRTIPTSARPCTITVGCAGTMQASVHRHGQHLPELWWA